MWGLPQKKNARRADKIRLCGHLRRYKKIVKKTYIISDKPKKESIIRVIEVLGDENEISNKLSCLKKDISLNLVDAEIFTGYYPINISFWDGGFYLL